MSKVQLELSDLDLIEESEGDFWRTVEIHHEEKGVRYVSSIHIDRDSRMFLGQEQTVHLTFEKQDRTTTNSILLRHRPQSIPELANVIQAILGIDVRRYKTIPLHEMIPQPDIPL